jgi:hypothetical protein
VEAVGAHDEIEGAVPTAREVHPNVLFLVDDRVHGVVEDQFGVTVEGREDHRRQRRSRDADVTTGPAEDRPGPDARHTATVAIDGTGLHERIPTPAQLGDDAHPFGHVEPGAPEVHNVAAAAQCRGLLDEGHLVSRAQ